MAESSVQNGVSKTSWGDEVSSNGSTNGGSARGDKKNTGIKAHPKSKDTHHTYSVYYYGEEIETTVTHRASVVDNWLDHLLEEFKSRLNNLVVGLDIEWRRLERNNKDSRRRKVAVLQLCVDNHCLIYQFSCCDKKTPESLKKFLADEELIFVGAGIEADAYKLMVDYGLKVARTEDLASFVAFKTGDSRLYKYGLKKLVKDVLKQDLPKSRFVQTSDWELSLLSNKQIEYACLDAVASFKLGVQLMSLGNPRHTYRKQVPPRLRKSNGGKTNGTNNELTN
ncbi:Werner syndrome ATP-dependent helicase homolog [Papaver somniferum]|uniref:Werner syndrome ATP-dependent helicase homolog n=1 Tax=Papaver somniferum TaxID=3469 RepID=UPI000E702D63|nr:Werner syndrome ATP-dependent helicase homolog [Papaver somniferum]